MKTKFNLIAYSIAILVLISRHVEADVVTFEDLTPPSGSEYYYGKDDSLPNPGFNSSPWTSGGVQFSNYYGKTSFQGFDYDYWGDFAYSVVKNKIDSGVTNQFAAYATASPGAGAEGSNTYGIFYGSSEVGTSAGSIRFASDVRLTSIDFANTTYTGLAIKNGDPYTKKFGDDPNTPGIVESNFPDRFEVVVYGFNNNVQVSSQSVVLADYTFADDADDYVLDSWLNVSFSGLPLVDELRFGFVSTDVNFIQSLGKTYINSPTYFAIDNLRFSSLAAVPEPSSMILLGLSGAFGLGYRVLRKRAKGAVAGSATLLKI